MLLRRIYDDKLAQASWLVGCSATGEALIIDPNRDVQQYIDAAEDEGLRITHVTETHIHADFVSGLRELVEATGARAYLSDEGGPDWSYRFAAEIDAVLLKDGAEFRVGNIRVQVLHSPGHTPEHISFIVTDTAGADMPMGVFTGDFVFVGDVGRPDLLEKAAGVAGTMEQGARQLFASLDRIRALPDWVQVWPGHGAGSACGKALGAVPSTTLGYEKLFNWAFSLENEREFIDTVLAGQPEPPRYFAEMKRINRDGPRVLGGFRRPPRLEPGRLADVLRDGGIVVDTRKWAEYRAGHAHGTLSIPLNRSFTTWAGSLLPYDRDIHLIFRADAGAAIDEAVRDLAMIGLDRIAGWFEPEAVQAAGPLRTIEELSVDELHERWEANDVAVIDVRGEAEWQANHIAGVPNIPLARLAERLDEVPRDRPVVLHCQSGSRSAIAASLLETHGIEPVMNVTGGFGDWARAGYPVESADVAQSRT